MFLHDTLGYRVCSTKLHHCMFDTNVLVYSSTFQGCGGCKAVFEGEEYLYKTLMIVILFIMEC